MEHVHEQYIARRIERDKRVLDRALTDPDFRRQLVQRPHQSLSDLYAVSIPESADVQVFEESDESHFVVIPPDMSGLSEELTDEQLEAVAGGWFVQLIWTTICVGSGKPGGT
ncbi:MAG TPA: NHLP leader peptide family RiPP precursor [Gemmatimonadaceae bacterium]|nr:NHLP leader peptide family RiPP precursor [Gemmatimonadaceae bacterium]